MDKISHAIIASTGHLNELLIYHSLGDRVRCADLSVKYTSNSFHITTGKCVLILIRVDTNGSVDTKVTAGNSKSN
jgi:hypothetical protein